MTKGLPEDHIAMFRNTLLQLLLKVTTAVLIFTERGDLSLQIFKAHTCESVDYGNIRQPPKHLNEVALTLSVDVTTLMLWTMQTIHFPIAVGPGANSKAILCPIMMI